MPFFNGNLQGQWLSNFFLYFFPFSHFNLLIYPESNQFSPIFLFHPQINESQVKKCIPKTKKLTPRSNKEIYPYIQPRLRNAKLDGTSLCQCNHA